MATANRPVITLLGKKRDEYREHDIAARCRITGYVHRHRAQRPHGDATDPHWRRSLMNWGHDPKEG